MTRLFGEDKKGPLAGAFCFVAKKLGLDQ